MINGDLLCDAFISGANNMAKHRKLVDSLNVFPVPDGDTGTNMSMTFGAAKRELEVLDNDKNVKEVAKVTAAALLRGARGNSGVILSLLFRGFAKGFENVENAEAKDIVKALDEGVKSAYKAVMKPTEGTMLTVARVSSEYATEALENNPDISAIDIWNIVVEGARIALESTPDLLPVLKKAGVVDAGGKGVLCIYEGMQVVLNGEGIITEGEEQEGVGSTSGHDMPDERNAAGEYEGEITFTYCTEFIVLKDKEKTSADAAVELRAFLESIGDSAVVVEDDDIIKIHVHTDHPGDAMQKGLESGQLTSMKIDNMREQHASNKKAIKASKKKVKKFPYAAVDPSREIGFVAVAAGDGIKSLFKDLAVDNVVSGGQTMNPSTDDILEAIHSTPAKNVIVLPNNKNIVLSAQQAERLADRKVYVLPSQSIPQGLAAMLAFDPDSTVRENTINMVEAIRQVDTGLITYAARDSIIDNSKIKKGEILALENGKLAFSDKDLTKSVLRLTRSLIKKDTSFITFIYGEDITDEKAQEIEELVAEKLPAGIECTFVRGDQPVYYFIISVE